LCPCHIGRTFLLRLTEITAAIGKEAIALLTLARTSLSQ
jgi:hypothetical protein